MYALVRKSCVRMILDTIQPYVAEVAYFDWDAHAEGQDLPKADLIGIAGFSCTEDHPFHDITFSVAIMVHDDPNLDRLITYTDLFYQNLRAHCKFPIYNPDGTMTGFEAVCFDGTQAAPMSRVDFRPTMEITVSARVTQAGDWPRRP